MKVPLFVELCAGLASVSGVLEHGSTWKPPVSRMGRKTGYAGAILRVMGLRPRQRAGRYLWAEADGDVAALLAAYTQPEKMREIAAIIRSWIPCPYGPHEADPSCSRCKGTGRWDARDLWEVLRRSPRRGLWTEDIAHWATLSASAYGRSPVDWDDGRWRMVRPDGKRSTVTFDTTAWSDGGNLAGHTADGFDSAALPWPPVTPTTDAAIQPAHIPPGTVVYMDPPYAGTTGYKASFSRDQVCETAERWATAGARVYISEAEPIAALGWHHVEITSERKGQARTFGATPEWLTCSHRPAWTPPQQSALFTRHT